MFEYFYPFVIFFKLLALKLSVINDWKMIYECVFRGRMDVPFMKSVEPVMVARLAKPFTLLFLSTLTG